LSQVSPTIAAAVEQQGAATQEISRSVQQAAYGTQEVSSTIAEVEHGASETGVASSKVLSAAQVLASDGHRLKLELNKFLATVRAAGVGKSVQVSVSHGYIPSQCDPHRKLISFPFEG
jgi:hypothetical protein